VLKQILYQIKKNKYFYFLAKLVLFACLLLSLDYGIGKTLHIFYFKQQSGFQNRITYSIEKTTEDVIIIGSSRAKHHYFPDTLEKKLNLSCYNTGNNGQHVFYYYAVLKGILKRYSPKIIILDLKFKEFSINEESYDRLSAILPYYQTHPELRPIIELRGPFEKYKLISQIYPYNSSLFTIAVGNMAFNKNRKTDENGYVPLYHGLSEPIHDDSTFTEYKFDRLKVSAYESFLKECIQAKVKLYVICSPYFVKSTNEEPSIKIGKEIAKKYNVEFIDYSNDSLFIHNPTLFADPEHLNDLGAKIFIGQIAAKIAGSLNSY
jgi:hypothetical protein